MADIERNMNVSADLIAEKILDEIRRAKRYAHIEKAWEALLNVRRISDAIESESKLTCGSDEGPNTPGG